MPAHRPQRRQVRLSASQASAVSLAPRMSDIADNRATALSMRFLHRSPALLVRLTDTTRDASASLATSWSMIVLPDVAPQRNHTAKLDELSLRQEVANPHFNIQGVHPRALVDAADTSPAASRDARRCPPEARVATPSTTKGEKARQPAPRCRSIEARENQSHGLFSVAPGQVGQVFSVFTSNRERSEFTPPRPHDPPQRFRKQGVGGFHLVFPSDCTPRSGAFA